MLGITGSSAKALNFELRLVLWSKRIGLSKLQKFHLGRFSYLDVCWQKWHIPKVPQHQNLASSRCILALRVRDEWCVQWFLGNLQRRRFQWTKIENSGNVWITKASKNYTEPPTSFMSLYCMKGMKATAFDTEYSGLSSTFDILYSVIISMFGLFWVLPSC